MPRRQGRPPQWTDKMKKTEEMKAAILKAEIGKTESRNILDHWTKLKE